MNNPFMNQAKVKVKQIKNKPFMNDIILMCNGARLKK